MESQLSFGQKQIREKSPPRFNLFSLRSSTFQCQIGWIMIKHFHKICKKSLVKKEKTPQKNLNISYP
eukprot:UN24939